MTPKVKNNLSLLVIFIIISGLFFIGKSGFDVLSGLRAYVGGEGLWTKGQKEATYQLVHYVFTGDEQRYESFVDNLKVPLGDKIARVELGKADPDRETVIKGFRDGGNHPSDIPTMIFLFTYFKNTTYVKEAIRQWRTGDKLIEELIDVGARAKLKIENNRMGPEETTRTLAVIDNLQKKLNEAEESFSDNMSAAARMAADILFFVMVMFTIIGGILCFFLFRLIGGIISDLSRKTIQLEDQAEHERALRKELQESEEKYRLLAENAADVIWILDMNLQTTFTSPSIEKMMGYTVKEAMDIPLSDKMTGPSFERILNAFMEELKLEEQGDADPSRSRSLELEQICKDKSTIWVESTMNFIRDGDGKAVGVLGITRNITERKQAEKAIKDSEEKLSRLKKMESLGVLAGGVAHDLNNVLSGILSYPELILLELPEDSKLRKPIEAIRESGQKAAAIVQDLLTVARGVATVKKPLCLNSVVETYLVSPEFSKLRQFHPDITVNTNLDESLLNVSGSQVHVSKVVMNLVTNAAEAVKKRGIVTISTMNQYVDRPIKGFHDINTGEYAVLSVSDNGPGIPPGEIERIFEPFYTKKVMGRSGTGLGLAVVWNTLQDHNGYIDVLSDRKGTTFKLYFPIIREDLLVENESNPLETYKGSGETILVIDDVETQRNITCSMLEKLGYNAESVSGGEEAVVYVKDHHVDLLVLDMIMDPGINGRETYSRILRIKPDQKAIIVSGFAETDEVKETIKAGAGQFVKKPFTLEQIAASVQKELGS